MPKGNLSIIIPKIPKGVSLPMAMVELDHVLQKKRLRSFEIIILNDKDDEMDIPLNNFVPEIKIMSDTEALSHVRGNHLMFVDIKRNNLRDHLNTIIDHHKKIRGPGSDDKINMTGPGLAVVPAGNEKLFYYILDVLTKTIKKSFIVEAKKKVPTGVCLLYIHSSCSNEIDNLEISSIFLDIADNDINIETMETKLERLSLRDYWDYYLGVIKHVLKKIKKKIFNINKIS